MKVVVLTDDRVGPVMAGSALRAWELARVLLSAGHDVVVAAASGSRHPEGHGPTVVEDPPWRWAEALVSPPWCLPPRAFLGNHLLVIDGITPLLAELSASPNSPIVRRRLRTAAARLPLVAARADAVLVAGDRQTAWWSEIFDARPDVPLLTVPFGIAEADPSTESCTIDEVPDDWSVVLWWGGVWPWLDLETLLAARSRLGRAKVSVVVPTAARPGATATPISATDLTTAAGRHGLKAPEVVSLERWIPYAERHRILNRSSLVAVLHRAGEETDLSFRTRALDGVWACVPLLVSEGGEVAEIARQEGWGGVVPPGNVELVAAAMDLLLTERTQRRCRGQLAGQRDDWRWSVVARPLTEAMEGLPATARHGLAPAMLRAAAALAQPSRGGVR
jgi:glycosyltransferase involved in cell wall biosynthesis